MGYGAKNSTWAPDSGSVHGGPVTSGERAGRPSAGMDTLSWIRALASQWEDEQSRPHAPGTDLDSDRGR